MSDRPPTPPSPDPASLDSEILRILMDTIPDRIYFKDLESRFVRNNTAHAHSMGAASPAECVGKTDFDFFSPEHAARALADEQRIIQTGEPMIGIVERTILRDGTQGWGSTTKMPWRDSHGAIIGTYGLTRDVTEAKDAEEKLTEERNLLRKIIDHLPTRLFLKDTQSRYVLNNQAHLVMLGTKTQEEATGRTTEDFFPGERGQQALADDRHVLETGQPILNQEKSNFGQGGDVQWSLVTKVPLHDLRGQLIGLVGISHDITRRKLAEQELQRRQAEMESDLRMARQVQEAFFNRAHPVFPRGASPESSLLRFSHRYIPATTLGGDFFDILQISDTKCGVLVCDVMGHGVRAGLLTALVRGVVEEMGHRAADPVHVLREVNHSLMPIIEQTGQPVFATIFFGVIDTAACRLTYGNAGHPPPLIRRAREATVARLAPADPEPAAGLLAEFEYSRHETDFQAGDLFFGYTDGILEAASPQGEMFGQDRLSAFLSAQRAASGSQVSERLLGELGKFSARNVFDDDVCLVTIESMSPCR